METYTIKTKFEVNEQKMDDLLSSFFLGSSWLTLLAPDIFELSKKYNGELDCHKLIILGGSMPCYERGSTVDDKTPLGELNIPNIISAIRAMAVGEDRKGKKNKHLKWHFNNFITGKGDMVTVDIIMQIAIMKEVLFA